MKKLKIMVIFGGKSGEHDVSLMSSASVMKTMNKEKYEIMPIGITKDGRWKKYLGNVEYIDPKNWLNETEDYNINELFLDKDSRGIDLVFPVLHGPFGEDGTIQGLLEMADIPYVGTGVLSSALAMDKVVAKMMLKSVNIPQAEFAVVFRSDFIKDESKVLDELENKFGYPMFVKPANLGSSVGISKAKNREGLIAAIKEAGSFDRKIVVEEFIDGREIECSVLGNENPKTSLPAEVVPAQEFYNYEDKYIDGKSELIVPAKLEENMINSVRELAVEVYKLYDCRGLSRVDFFLERNTNRLLVNEVNTMPGFTSISMYPKMWEATGLAYGDLIDQLIELALDFAKNK
ncbi:D-alanine--D-alanine ligase family protein [Serpentinicella alkaliphila]|uniref:D-alanine--D-alanine ligase n=1 Tax=Serpentinicella alkaliphila TaxID=1734049 RepID=A0A4R2TM94_9FIRM|nr:D-alanine--D-alanine ligase family protein [Serpentinicella alkaliphila]QUH25338.1 D-alanine--D-alanine ligase [Serpentinicella alkaliphila]TCQ02375.1 D-alanine-D-alanine ligase [Serpentinicella alkaliphila]